MTKKTKTIIIIVLAILVLGGLSYSSKKEDKPIEPDYSLYNSLVEKLSDNNLTNLKEFDPQDKDSGYYRVEYRLPAYKNSKAGHGYIIDDKTEIDIVNYDTDKYSEYKIKPKIRVYLKAQDFDTMKKAFYEVAKDLGFDESEFKPKLEELKDDEFLDNDRSVLDTNYYIQSGLDDSYKAMIDGKER